jgi:WD40 repeat protein
MKPLYRKVAELQGTDKAISKVRWSPDGRWLASGSLDKTLALYAPDLHGRGGTDVPQKRFPQPHWVYDISWSPDSSRVACACHDGSVTITDISTGMVLQRAVHDVDCLAVAWAPDGETLATGSKDRTIGLWRSADLAPVHDRLQVEARVACLLWSQDGSHLWAGCTNGAIVDWAPSSAAPTLLHAPGRIWTLLRDQRDTLVAAAEGGSVCRWAWPSREQGPTAQIDRAWLVDLAESACGDYLAAVGRDGTVRLWRADMRSPLLEIRPSEAPSAPRSTTPSVAWHPEQAVLASTQGTASISVWEIDVSQLSDPTCAVVVAGGQPCRRPLVWPGGTTRHSECIMHSSDPEKGAAFVRELERMLEAPANAELDFTEFVFTDCHMAGRTFEQPLSFRSCHFRGVVDFRNCQFQGPLEFSLCDLSSLSLEHSTFHKGLRITSGTVVDHGAEFTSSSFLGEVLLDGSHLKWGARFRGSRFAETLTLHEMTCNGVVDLSGARFHRGLSIVNSDLLSGSHEQSDSCNLDLSDAQFLSPGRLYLNLVNKRTPASGLRLCILNANVEQARFEDVHWYRRGGRLTLSDEIDYPGLAVGKGATRELVASAYRRMVESFDAAGAVDLAEECFCAAMDIDRQNPSKGRFARGMMGLYRFASVYGSSYVRAALVLLVTVLLAFPLAYLSVAADLAYAPFRSDRSPIVVPGAAPTPAGPTRGTLASTPFLPRCADAVVYSLEVVSFQREPMLQATGTNARAIRAAEVAAAPGQLALLLLALRRRFRR